MAALDVAGHARQHQVKRLVFAHIGRCVHGDTGPGRGFSAASVNYGGCPKGADQALAGTCPVVGSYGGKDRSPMGRSAARHPSAGRASGPGSHYGR